MSPRRLALIATTLVLSGVRTVSALAAGCGFGFATFLAVTDLVRFPAPCASLPMRVAGFGFAGETMTGSSVPGFWSACADADLSAATKTGVAVARALRSDPESTARFIVLDEPTATLPDNEVHRLLAIVRAVAARGIGVLYVTHRLNEIFEIGDNGRGIDPKDHQRIFDLFRRAGTQDRPGQGIGLAHVRALVRRLVPFHSFSARPQRVAKMMMLAMCNVQLEKSYLPILVCPME